ncbi:Uncharacterized 2Fe-2 and 4Fe-4S clusters-containing protein, contains DUF4445 domain [Desulfocicer vacuolatum DSM 3385]|uniref:Uncharacterized 2Fe-2 and 4Fe-4S clusters-containing protein, contains DUF4445 domain n=1 Tax=Desulfocicer vacuolatum DSM 3385 TaxID=1121400 RepID=A0A1W2CJP1_9BACT|nr:ASKHA domain-containing protein [Desulfocicer vacuolatum]SMC85457.1 Uncharacterized 2Fe-2 and 4Fe-4S clusters-containing protein, contains DUF4445 domain [Desulfocicer vacuolatum DSM 3385]
MINIMVDPIGITVEMNEGETLHDGLERAGISIETPCGGQGVCGACKVWVAPPTHVPSTPHEDISQSDDQKGLRLACQAIPEKDITIRLEDNFVYDKATRNQGRILLQNSSIGKNGSASAVRLIQSQNQTVLVHDRAEDEIPLPTWQPHYTPKGLAIDIGTTTMVLSLVSLETGEILASGSSLNPQIVHGHDVLTRIQYAETPEGLEEMASLVQNKLNALLAEACETTHTHPDEIVDVTIGANTTMLQLAAKIDPTPLGRVPFTFDIKGGTTYPAEVFGLNVNKAARVYLPPVMHAFVGTDITAGLILCPEFFDDNKSILYIDMGTNGEMCLNVKGRRFTTSTAAGPAFEGMGLSTGMRATDGAVEKVSVNKDGIIEFQTIGGGKVKGVCGSGIVDFIATLLTTGILDPSGKLANNDEKNASVMTLDDQPAFEYGEGVHLTQKDIRQIQLAKGAVRTGVDLILQSGGITCDELDSIYVAGGFGNYLKPANMERIGLLPENTADKVIFCGNASIDGSTILLTQGSQRLFLEKAMDNMEHLQLADSPEFMNCFVTSLGFPPARESHGVKN